MVKNKLCRRKFISHVVGNLAFLILTNTFLLKRLNSKTRPKIVIVGLGIGGATCLQYLNKISNFVEIIVIEKQNEYQTGPLSNLVIGNILERKDICFQINKKRYKNVKFIFENVKRVDVENKSIIFSKNFKIKYDFLILSPGISYKKDILQGYSVSDKKNIPHCWDGESNITQFKKRLADLEDNSKIIITSPDYPYRCPPAPYERASLIANYQRKLNKKVKILILDSKNSFTKQENFFREWQISFRDVIEWIPREKGGKVIFFDQKKGLVKNSDGQTFRADFIHIIPEQKAASIFFDSDLLNGGKDWCEINPVSFEINRFKDIYAVGDSINAWAMPKSAFSANSQAKILAINLINKILEKDYIDPVFLNTCYSFSKEDRAFSISAWYRLNVTKDKIISLGSSESDVNANNEDRKLEARHAIGWYETMVNDLFI